MIAFLKALILLPVAVIVLLFAIANRGPVTLSLDPFAKGAPEIAFALPLYAVVLASVVVGVVLGGVGAWLSGGRRRRVARLSRREARRHKAEADRLRTSLAAARAPTIPAGRPPGPAALPAPALPAPSAMPVASSLPAPRAA